MLIQLKVGNPIRLNIKKLLQKCYKNFPMNITHFREYSANDCVTGTKQNFDPILMTVNYEGHASGKVAHFLQILHEILNVLECYEGMSVNMRYLSRFNVCNLF